MIHIYSYLYAYMEFIVSLCISFTYSCFKNTTSKLQLRVIG